MQTPQKHSVVTSPTDRLGGVLANAGLSTRRESGALRGNFWLHEIDATRIRIATDGPAPADYAKLTEDERLSVAEFIDFLHVRRTDPPTARRRKFFLRDHANRPAGTALQTPAAAPAAYESCVREERFHVHELIQFLLRRRTLQK